MSDEGKAAKARIEKLYRVELLASLLNVMASEGGKTETR